MPSIFRLGGLQEFLARAAELNALHDPEATAHDYLRMDGAAWRAATDAAGPEPKGDIADAIRARKALTSLHKEFPAGNPVHEQAAYLLRGFSGLQPFARASDLTGWDLVAETLEHHGFDLLAESEDGRALASSLWTRLQAGYPSGLTRKDLLTRDEAFEWLANWFRTRIMASGVKADVPEKQA